ncbi:MAG: DegV family protein [Oscillospiraceae bacterium]|nr:DegV family protein [Oscillospiraceae bacterium]
MAKPVCITADSTCDLSSELLQRFGIRVIPLTINLGDESFLDGEHFTPLDMYRRYRTDGVLPKTAAPSVQDFMDFFSGILDEGYEIVHLDISAELSNTANAARLAASEFSSGVYTVDSRMLSTGVGLLAIEGAERAADGMAAADIARHLIGLTGKVETSFVLDTLEFMAKGGRCSNFAALGANLLKLKPALEMKDGKLGVYKKYRGNIRQVYQQYIRERLGGKQIRPGHIFLTESGEVEPEVVTELEKLIRELVPVREIHHTLAGCTVSSHCGPRTLGVLFIDE